MLDIFIYIVFLFIIVVFWIYPTIRACLIHETLSGMGAILLFTIIFFDHSFVLDNFWVLGLAAVLTLAGITISALGVASLAIQGKAKHFDDTTKLIERGVFRIFRHPLYYGIILIDVGIILMKQNWFAILLGIVSIALLLEACREEESYNLKKFGSSYKKYLKRAK